MTPWVPHALLLVFVAATPSPEQRYFRFQRPIPVPPGASRQACAVLGPDLFAHAAGSLADLRLYDGAPNGTLSEQPFALTLSEATTPTADPAAVLNLGARSGHIAFDLDMPLRDYTSVNLELAAKDFLATAKVTGHASTEASDPGTELGEFTLYDLSSQHLSRSSTLNMQESNFPRLHVELTMTPVPGTPTRAFAPSVITGASVPPSREAQTLYTTVAETAELIQKDRQTIAHFEIPARVPVERVEFVLPKDYKSNFSRPVQITARAGKSHDPNATPEQIAGEISRVQLTPAGHAIHQQVLTVPATLGSNLQSDAVVQVAVNDGDDRPVPFSAVRLQMRQRELCFEPSESERVNPPTLFYGDPGLHAPVYDYARLFSPASSLQLTRLAPEQANPTYTPRAEARPFTERHPELLWIVLSAVVAILGLTALRTARRLPR